jgi:uncharacterized protein (DUF362 family)
MAGWRIDRRAFLYGAAGSAIGLASLSVATAAGCGWFESDVRGSAGTVPCRGRVPNPYLENGKPVVAVVRGTEFKSMLAKGMELLGGFARLGAERPVVIKPNFVWAHPYPTSTDGASILSVIELLKREGFGEITVAEYVSKRATAGGLGESFDFYGFNEKATAGGFKLDGLEGGEVVEVGDARWTALGRVGVFSRIYNAPLVIDMPTLKEHSFTKFTCALKNMMGAVDERSCAEMHLRGRRDITGEVRLVHSRLAIAEIAHAVNPDLTIIDARTVLGKTHAVFAGGVPREANRVIISGDAVAADYVAAQVLAECYEPFAVEMLGDTLTCAAGLGLGAAEPKGIVVKEAVA